jgi:hypothetical protein
MRGGEVKVQRATERGMPRCRPISACQPPGARKSTLRSPFAPTRPDLPFPKPFRGAILPSQPPGIWRSRLKRDPSGTGNYLPEAPKQPFGYPGRCHRILGGNVDARHHCYLCRLGSSIDHFGASRPFASKQSRSNRTHCLPYRASGRRMRVRISAHPLAGSVGPLALGPLHFEDAQESISRKHGELVEST